VRDNDNDGPEHHREPRVGSDSEVREAVTIGQALTQLRRAPWARLLDTALLDGTESGLEQGEVDTLDAIARNRDSTMTEVAERLQITRSTATRAVERLENRGLAERYRANGYGRTVRVRPTDAGTRAYWELSNRRVAFLLQVLQSLAPEEREILATLIPRIAEITVRNLNAIGAPIGAEAGEDGQAPG
jgi:DNA-binding MarR family transcriptional regulator